ncbi:MAG: preprotein translocase subunit SecF [Frankiaceae bacterium]|jgi:preprotein translocase subunit SecF|nr:preprotein translocase subunit SecF [Frankiaceae bacterium]
MARKPGHESFATRLYRGELSYNFVGRRRLWYAVSGAVMFLSVVSILVRGLHPSIDFKGGVVFQFPKAGHSIADARAAVTAAGVTPEVVTITGSGSDSRFRIETKALSQAIGNNVVAEVTKSIADRFGLQESDVNSQSVGSTWGSQITKKAIYGLVFFLIAVIIYLSFRFEWKMAFAAIIALLHDLLITAGIYSLVGFEVSPSTVIALLTILGYSLYDTVVVFDKVRENTAGLAGSSRMTFTDAANLAVNQTLVRSINTSIIALLPVAGLLIIGAGLLGAGSLKDLALALLIGLASGAYSSIFIATPIVADLKEREPTYQALARRVEARRARPAAAAVATAGPAAGAQPERMTAATATAVLDDEPGSMSELESEPEPEIESVERPRQAAPGPRPGTRPGGAQQRRNRGGRPGGRGGRPKKRR